MDHSSASQTSHVHHLRTTNGLTMEVLARHCALSIRQLRQIEEGGHDAFYSPAIKQLAERKVLWALRDPQALQAMQKPPIDAFLPRNGLLPHLKR